MADPICRWRNPYLETVRELISVLPGNVMPIEEARRIINERWEGDFFHTPYQMACQLALYYESEGIYYPRFTNDPALEEVLKYLRGWILNYYIPNPFTKQGFEDSDTTIIHSRLCELLIERNERIAWPEVKEIVFREEIGNDDILRNTVNTYSDVLSIEKGFLDVKKGVNFGDLENFVLPSINIDRDNKESFFHLFDKFSRSTVRTEYGSSDFSGFLDALLDSGLLFPKKTVTRFISSLVTKPFVILSGLSGSGKTKLAQAFVKWICLEKSQYCIVPVGADWTSREPLLGYPNAIKTSEYIKPENGTLDLILRARQNENFPYFLILDEMNLSHVERYFADFLSVMESDDEMLLHSDNHEKSGVPPTLKLPDNLFIVGTVNIDETTYMFSPKVLDRANTIEFRVNRTEIEEFFLNGKGLDMSKVEGGGAAMAEGFLALARNGEFAEEDMTGIHKTLTDFFEPLKKAGAEFGFRSASEMIRLISQLSFIDSGLSENEKIDIAIMQKILPKLHGSRRKLSKVLGTLGGFCLMNPVENVEKDVLSNEEFDYSDFDLVKYPVSLEKIARMYRGAVENGFASYAEA